jgi:hypothetical protein
MKGFDMNPVLRCIAAVVAPTAAFYFACLLVAEIAFVDHKGPLDANRAGQSVFNTPPEYVVFKSDAFAVSAPVVVLTGASNVAVGFSRELIESRLDGVDVHNAALGGARVDDMASVADLVFAQRPRAYAAETIVVVGIWYGTFLHTVQNRAGTHVAQQMRRFDLFQPGPDGHPRVRLQTDTFKAAVRFLEPAFLVGHAFRQNGLFDRAFGTGGAESVYDAVIGRFTCDKDYLETFQARELANPDTVHESQFLALISLAAEIQARGARLVVVDLPISSCVTDISTQFARYQAIKGPLLAQAEALGAVYINLQEFDAGDYFLDITHPSEQGRRRLSNALVDAMDAKGLVFKP